MTLLSGPLPDKHSRINIQIEQRERSASKRRKEKHHARVHPPPPPLGYFDLEYYKFRVWWKFLPLRPRNTSKKGGKISVIYSFLLSFPAPDGKCRWKFKLRDVSFDTFRPNFSPPPPSSQNTTATFNRYRWNTREATSREIWKLRVPITGWAGIPHKFFITLTF